MKTSPQNPQTALSIVEVKALIRGAYAVQNEHIFNYMVWISPDGMLLGLSKCYYHRFELVLPTGRVEVIEVRP